MFRNAKVGDRAYDILRGWGTIVAIKQDSEYPICFKADIDSFCTFTFDGKRADISPSLFWDEIKFEVPVKAFNLEEELRKLEVVEFKNEYNNYFIYWSNNFQEICLTSYTNIEIPMIKYFSKESAYNFKKSMNNKNITKEQFFSAYKKVFGGID